MTTLLDTTWTLDTMADLRTCCLCEATYDARTMAEELRHNEYCPKCMEEEFGADWADLTATEEQKYGKEGKPADSTGWKKDPHHKCLLCEKTYNSDDIAEHLRERELCSECMGKGKGKGSGTRQHADDDGSTCCSDDEEEEYDDE